MRAIYLRILTVIALFIILYIITPTISFLHYKPIKEYKNQENVKNNISIKLTEPPKSNGDIDNYKTINNNKKKQKPAHGKDKGRVNIFDNTKFEFVVRTTCLSRFIDETKRWLIKSLKLFWLHNKVNLVIVLNKEEEDNTKCSSQFKESWPYPDIRFRAPANDPQIYRNNDRFRMYWDYFYPETYTRSEYIGFLDTDSMFVTPLIPEILFTDGSKPVINARIGMGHSIFPCWSDTSEYMIGKKEVVQCMTYFPVIYKVQHVVEARVFISQRLNKTFDEIYGYLFQNNDCMCQYSVICNYLWYYHRDEYDWHLLTHPTTGIWNGEQRRNSQETPEYFKSLSDKYKIPKPRVAVHIRHYMIDKKWLTGEVFEEPALTVLTQALKQGLCFAYGFNKCPEKCNDFNELLLQNSLFTFEDAEWFFDKRCTDEQKRHYKMVDDYLKQNKIDYNCTLFDTL